MLGTLSFWIHVVAALIGTAAFAVTFRLNPRHLPLAILGGGITFAVYEVVYSELHSVFAAAFLASSADAALTAGRISFFAIRSPR
jgi:uncharacterized membrane protein YjjB (DUF3815 family)